jgi:curved DNA-binding protein CbpA
MIDYYATLGVSPEAPPEVIKAAYRALAQKHHPDRHGADPAADEATRLITQAFRVLSDPASRAAYDETRRASVQPQRSSVPVHRAAAPVTASAAGHEFTLRFIPGTVISNDLWSETHVSSRGGGGMTVAGFGYNTAPKVRSQAVAKQRIGVRSPGRDVFVDQAGSHIPIALGQDVELVQASGHRTQGIVAIVNRSSGQWFWIGSQMDAGSLIRKPSARFVDFIAYLAVVALCAGGLWALWVRGSGFLVWAAFIVLGIPALFGAATPMLFRTANRIGAAMRSAISRAVEQPIAR